MPADPIPVPGFRLLIAGQDGVQSHPWFRGGGWGRRPCSGAALPASLAAAFRQKEFFLLTGGYSAAGDNERSGEHWHPAAVRIQFFRSEGRFFYLKPLCHDKH